MRVIDRQELRPIRPSVRATQARYLHEDLGSSCLKSWHVDISLQSGRLDPTLTFVLHSTEADAAARSFVEEDDDSQ